MGPVLGAVIRWLGLNNCVEALDFFAQSPHAFMLILWLVEVREVSMTRFFTVVQNLSDPCKYQTHYF